MTRLEEVASKAGVSMSTVSRALTRPDMVAAQTRDRVLAAAEQLGYHHNSSARALATGRTRLIGLSVPTLANPFFAPIIAGAQKSAEQAGNELVVVVSGGRPAHEHRLLSRLRGRVDGLVAVAPRGPSRQIVAEARSLPVVLVNRTVRGVGSVVIDTPDGMAQLGRHLVALGHRRVTYLGGPPGSWMDRKRQRALTGTLAESGGDVVPLGPVEPTYAAGTACATEIVSSASTAIVAYNSVLALGLLHQLSATGVRVPEDVSVACADDLTEVGLAVPEITAVNVPAEEAGQRAIQLVLERLANWNHADSDHPPEVRLPVTLVEGASTARTARTAVTERAAKHGS